MTVNSSSHIQVPADSTGKKVETTKIRAGDLDGTEYERQRMELPDLGPLVTDVLRLILIEMRVQSMLMAEAFEVVIDLDHMRGSIGDKL